MNYKACRRARDKGCSIRGEKSRHTIDDFSPSIVRDSEKCILCRRCVSACDKLQGVSVIAPSERGFKTVISTAFNLSLNDSACTMCGQCITACPVGALHEKEDTEKVWDALANPEKHVIVQPAPAIRVSLGEEFGLDMGTPAMGKMVAALRRLGFDKVFDTDFTADLTIIEEGNELLHRIKNNGKLPMITSCSPGWIKFCEHYFPEFLDNLSTAIASTNVWRTCQDILCSKAGIDPANLSSIMPTAKIGGSKTEMTRDIRC